MCTAVIVAVAEAAVSVSIIVSNRLGLPQLRKLPVGSIWAIELFRSVRFLTLSEQKPGRSRPPWICRSDLLWSFEPVLDAIFLGEPYPE